MISRTAPAETNLRQYICQRTASSIKIDGRLDELSWQWAAKLGLFVKADHDTSTLFHTDAMLLWDERNLYVAFICADSDIWSTKNRRDDSLFEEESVEIFIGPYGDEGKFIELGVNPLNTVYDLLISKAYSLGGKADWSWNIKGLQTAVMVDGTVNERSDRDVGWTVEIAIPWEAMDKLWPGVSIPPKNGDKWRLKLLRIDRPGSGRIGIIGWCDSPHPGKFGFLKFSKVKVGSLK